jgi:starch synthase/alpha-amylase
MAKKIEIPCLFTVQNPGTAKNFLSYIEDRGIDAAAFWQHLCLFRREHFWVG